MKSLLVLFVMLTFGIIVSAQEVWSLERCIAHAIENNITVKTSKLNVELQEQNLDQTSISRLPSVNGFASNTYNFGQTIDPFTNQFAQDRVRSNQFAVQAQMTLFNGLQQHNSVQSNQIELQARLMDLEQVKNNIALAVANAYLNVVSNEEQLNAAIAQQKATEKLLEQNLKLFQAGSIAQGNVLNIEAQLAGERATVTQAMNNLDLSLLSLQQLLQLPYKVDFRIEKPEIAEQDWKIEVNADQLYNRSLTDLPQIKAAQLRLNRSEKEVAVAYGGLSPRLAFNASIGTGYSGRNEEIIAFTQENRTIGTTTSGELVSTLISTPTETRIKPFSTQLDENFNQSVGLSLTVPIFNGFNNKTNISRAKISREIQELNLLGAQNTLREEIQNAYATARASERNYKAQQQSVSALKEAFKYTQKQFEVGAIDPITFNNGKTQLAIAENNLIQARYSFIFALKVLDFYQGKPITLD